MKFIKKALKIAIVAVLVAAFALSVAACDTDNEVTPETYTVTFETNGGSSVSAQYVDEGNTAVRPDAPSKNGYEFVDWFADSSCSGDPFDFDTAITQNLTLYALWQQTADEPDDPDEPDNPDQPDDPDNPDDPDDPDQPDQPDDPVGPDEPDEPVVEYVNVTLVYNYDDKTETKTIEKNTVISLGTEERAGYTFLGWFEDAALSALFDLNTLISEDTTLYAKWKQDEQAVTFTVTFVTNGGTAVDPVTVNSGETIQTLPETTREGYTFEGWYVDSQTNNPYIPDSVVTDNLTLYAKWAVISDVGETVSYTVTFDTAGGSEVSSQTVTEGQTATPPATPSYEGKQFVNWYSDAQCTNVYDFTTPVTADITLYAGWVSNSNIISSGGYFESLFVTWNETTPSAASVYYSDAQAQTTEWTQIDGALIRSTGNNVARADVIGLKAGSYYVKVKTSAGNEITLPSPITVTAYDRSGYAHFNYTDGIGAYNDDGTIKNTDKGTLVIYVTEENKNDISQSAYVNGEKVDISEYLWNGYKGIGYLLNNRQYNSNTERAKYGIQALSFYYDAVAIRIIGTVNAEDANDATKSLIEGLTAYNSTENGGSTGDDGRMARITNAKNVTIEGVGTDACIYGWGVHFISNDNLHVYEGSGKSFEVRNITFEHYPEDAIGMEGTQGTKVDETTGSITAGDSSASADLVSPVERCWIHNNVFLPGYCALPAESDKAEGDGSCDFKRGQYYTLSYNYFEYCHKTNLIGSSDTSLTYNVTMHHNWWNNCGSRIPLARRANIHFYNNYITGDSTDSNASLSYVTSLRANCLVFSEANYYDGSKNVTQLKDGVGVSYNNVYYSCTGENAYIELSSRTQTVENSCAFIGREIDYSQFYISPDQFYYDTVNQVSDCLLDDAVTARSKVIAYAGVNGFGSAVPSMVANSPSSAVVVGSDGLIINLSEVAKGTSTVSNVLFTNITGVSSGTVKGKGQIITFTLTSEAELTVTASASSTDYYGELVSSDGTVWANKFTSLTIVLPAGTYAIASGDRAKELTVSSLSFADTATSSAARVQAVKDAVNALPQTVTLDDGALIRAAQQAFSALTATEKTAFESENGELYVKLNSAVIEYEKLLVDGVIAKIDAIGTVTATSYDAINAAQTAYDSLDGSLRSRVTNYQTLTAAWTSYKAFAVGNLIDQINELIDVGSIAITDKSAIDSAKASYDAAVSAYGLLDEEQQAEVTNYSKVTDGISAIEQLYKLFDFRQSLENTDVESVTISEGATLKTLYDSLTSEQKAVLSAEEIAKYDELCQRYEALASQTQTCSFEGAPSNPDWTVSGNYNSVALTVNSTGETFAKGLKMESSTSVTFSTGAQMQLTLYFSSTATDPKVTIDGTSYSISTAANGDSYVTVTLEAGSHSITKNTANTFLYLAVLSPIS